MLRSLHPDREVLEYQPCWTGDAWRQVRFTPAPAALEDNRHLAGTHDNKRGRPSLARMQAWLTEEPRTAQRAASDLGISYNAAMSLLVRLIDEHRCARIMVRKPRTRVVKFYLQRAK